jgi:hypothetical protein
MKLKEQLFREGKMITTLHMDYKGTLREYARRELSYPYNYNEKTNEVTVFKLDGKTIYSMISEYWPELES